MGVSLLGPSSKPRLSVSLFGNTTMPESAVLNSQTGDSASTDLSSVFKTRTLRNLINKTPKSKYLFGTPKIGAREEVRFVQPLKGGIKEPGLIPIVREVKTMIHNQAYEHKVKQEYDAVTAHLPSDKALANFFKRSLQVKAHQEGITSIFEAASRLQTKQTTQRTQPLRVLKQVQSLRTTSVEPKKGVPVSFKLQRSVRTISVDPRRLRSRAL